GGWGRGGGVGGGGGGGVLGAGGAPGGPPPLSPRRLARRWRLGKPSGRALRVVQLHMLPANTPVRRCAPARSKSMKSCSFPRGAHCGKRHRPRSWHEVIRPAGRLDAAQAASHI